METQDFNNSAKILIESYTRRGNSWLEGDLWLKGICRKITEAFMEDLSLKGHGDSWQDYRIDNFVVLRTSSNRANRLMPKSKSRLEHKFVYEMWDYSNRDLVSEKCALVIETYDTGFLSCNDLVKWRVRNAFGKIIENARHPNGFRLETRVFNVHDFEPSDYGIILPKYPSEIFYVHGDSEFREYYDKEIPAELKDQKISL